MNNNKAKVFGSQNKLINKLKQLNQRQVNKLLTPSQVEIESDLQGYRQYQSEYDEEEEDEEEKENNE